MFVSNAGVCKRLLALCAAAALASRARAQDSIPATARFAPVARALTALIEHERAQKGIPAISIALVDGGRIVWAYGSGWADSARGARATASTVYRVGSVSKLFTDAAIMRLVEQRKLGLDTPVQRYLPDFHPSNPFGGEITIRELTSHRAGLTREPPIGNYFDDRSPTLAATVASLNGTALVYPPGTHTKYSNAGVAVLGYVLERTQHEPFERYLQRTLLAPMGLDHSAFAAVPMLEPSMAKGTMWTLDGRRFDAPTFQLGMSPAGSMYSTVLDLGRFLEVLFGGGVAGGQRILSRATIDSMWVPQFAPAGARTGYGIGFAIGSLAGHRTVGHDGAIYGFATSLLAMPEDSLGVIAIASLDVANAVTDHIAQTALRMMLDAAAGRPLAAVDTTAPLAPGRALALMGRYHSSTQTLDLDEYEGRLFLTPARGGSRVELRVPVSATRNTVVVDDPLAFGQTLELLDRGRIVSGADTLVRVPVSGSEIVPTAWPEPPPAPPEYASVIGEYGWDHDVLYIREKDGKLNALIEWAFDYPLERVSRDVYRFPAWGLYDGQEIVFHRGRDGRADRAMVATVNFPRRPLPRDDDRTNARITPVRSPSELRSIALAASPPAESGLRAPDLVELRSLDSSIHYDIRYATSNNFMGTPFYTSAHAFMQRPAAEAVARAAAELRKLGYGLIIHDAYRPWYVTKMFWDGTPPDKHVFVADPSQGSRHNRGCAVDLTLYDLKTGAPIRMTGGYDEFSDRSYPLYPGGTSLQRWHRDLLRHAMEAQGFTVYDAEWWHFDYKDWRSYPIGNRTFEQLTARPRGGS